MKCRYCGIELEGDSASLGRCAFGQDVHCRSRMLARVKVLEELCGEAAEIIHNEPLSDDYCCQKYPQRWVEHDAECIVSRIRAALSPKEQSK